MARSLSVSTSWKIFSKASHAGSKRCDAAATATLQQALHWTFVAMLMLSLLIVFLAIAVPDVRLKDGPGDRQPGR